MNRLLIFLLMAAAFACSPKSNDADDEQALLRIHEESREAHFKKNAQAMVDQFAADMLSVNAGKVHKPSREADMKMFQQYFNSVEFRKWDDVNPPVIRFADDHSLAYVVVDKLVELETTDNTGSRIVETTRFAWVSIFRKQTDGSFRLECIASTNGPETVVKL